MICFLVGPAFFVILAFLVIPAEAGIQTRNDPASAAPRGHWIPAFAGMTEGASL